MRPLSLSCIVAAAMPTILLAAPGKSEPVSGFGTGSTGTGVVLEMAAILAGVVLLILALGWLIKRMGNLPTAGKGIVRILGGVSLGPREKAVVLEAGNQRLLVGVAPGSVRTLCLLDGSATVDDISSNFSTQLDVQLQEDSK